MGSYPRCNREQPVSPRLLLAVAVSLAIVAVACHPWDRHVGTIHEVGSGAAAEEFCTDVNLENPSKYPAVTDEDVNTWVGQALYLNTAEPYRWDTVLGVLFSNRGDCDDLSAFDLEQTELRYWITEVPQCGGEFGCALDRLCKPDPLHSGQHDCQYFDIFLHPLFFSAEEDFRNYAINHETGHALGLEDPLCEEAEGTCQVSKGGEYCYIRFNLSYRDSTGTKIRYARDAPVLSVMHGGGWCCPDPGGGGETLASCEARRNLPFPSREDRNAAQAIADRSE